jgi:HK97 family phage portal protein
MHIRYAYKDDPFWGVDPLTWAATSTALVAEQAGLARDQVRRGFASDVVFQSKTAVFGDDNLANAAFNRLKTQLRDAWHRMTRGGDPILLEGGYEARVISQSGREAQFHENLLTGLEDIARAFGVPGSLVNLNKSQSYGSMAEDARSLVRTCLAPWSTWLQTEMQVALLTREERAAGLEIVLDLSGLMRGDSEAEFKAVTAAVTAGVLSPNEGRDWFGYNPKDGGDEILRPMNMEAASNA